LENEKPHLLIAWSFTFTSKSRSKFKSKQNTDMSTRWPYRQQHGSCANHNDSEKTMATRSYSKCNFTTLNPGFFRIHLRKFCPTVIGCYYWNGPPLSIRNMPTRKRFKKSLYQVLFCSVLINSYLFLSYVKLTFYPNYNCHLNKGIQLASYILPFPNSLLSIFFTLYWSLLF